jgi:hypothetical protein
VTRDERSKVFAEVEQLKNGGEDATYICNARSLR